MEGKVNTMHTAVSDAVLYVLKYYSLFRYPLTLDEVYGNCSLNCRKDEIAAAVTQLVASGAVHVHGGYYSTDEQIEMLVARRTAANKLAAARMPKATKIGRLIARFPFVRFVGISGSLSKGYADDKSDFDFFIITAENRLWVCRTILHLFKKITFLFFQQHKFCMNYFLDTSRLELEEQNIYTAIELATLVPVAGAETGEELVQANKGWMKSFLPNKFAPFIEAATVANAAGVVKGVAEGMLDPAGGALNHWLMKITDKRWRKKWGRRNYPESEYNMAFKTTLHHSKNHPANYQKKILAKLGG